jgi:HK97 family phage major capsid protein
LETLHAFRAFGSIASGDHLMAAEPVRVVSALPTGTALSRYLMVLGASRGDGLVQHTLAEKFLDSPQVKATFEWRTKAAVAAGTTTDATWAGPLAPYGIAKELLTLLRGASILGQLETRFRRVPFRTRVSRETGSGTGGAWVGEGLSTPVAATAYDTLSQEAYKAQKIVILSKDLLLLGNPDAERTVRETVVAGVAAFLDAQLLTSTVTLSAGLRPAAITNGATAITSTGSTAAQINADLAGMLAAITTGGAGLVWIMRPLTAYKIAATIGGTAAADIPRTLFGIPLILSENSPQQITLVDAAHVLYSDTGGVDVDTSDKASIQFDDAPTDPAVAATVFRSLFQNNLWGIKVTRWIAYLRAQTGAVTYMTVAY